MRKFLLFILLTLLCAIPTRYAFAQTVTMASANSPTTNGIAAGPLVNGQTGLVIYGVTITVSGGSYNVNQLIFSTTQNGFFQNAFLYRASGASVNFSGSTQIATIGAFGGNYISVSGLNETITNTSKTYFIVADLTAVPTYVSLPASDQVSLTQIIQSSPYTDVQPTPVAGINYTCNNPTFVLTDANTSANGITQGNVTPSQTNVVLFGFGISISGSSTISTLNLNAASNQNYLSYYLGNGRLYRSTSSTFNIATATLVSSGSNVTFSNYQYTPGVTITNLSETITSTPVYYFLVADFTGTGSNTTLPANLQINLATSQSNAFITNGNQNIAPSSNITGSTVTFANPTYNLTSANAAGNGITQGALTNGQTGIVLFGFGIGCTANATVSGFNVYDNYSGTASQGYFGNGKIYRTSSSTFSTGTATLISGATVSFGSDQNSGIQISGLSESLAANASPVYYFVVADYSVTYGTTPATTQFEFLTSQTNPIVQSSPSSANVTVGSNIAGTTFSLIQSYYWSGNSDVYWGNSNNWVGSNVPPNNGTANVIIPGSLTRYPITQASNFDNDAATTISLNNLTINSGASLSVVKNNSLSVQGSLTGAGTLIFTAGFANGTTNPLDGNNTLTIASGATTSIANITFNKSAKTNTVTLASGNGQLNVTGLVTPTAGTLVTNGTLTLASSSAGSATMGIITPNFVLSGNVNVQRYLAGGTGKRGYRLLSSPVNAGGGLISINYLAASSYITGSTVNSSGPGIDQVGNPTLYVFNEGVVPSPGSYTAGNFRGIGAMGTGSLTNTTYTIINETATTIPIGNGYLFFFRGDRSMGPFTSQTSASYAPTPTILSATGTLNSGSITVKDWFTPASTSLSYTITIANNVVGSNIRGYNLIGNPYAATINWEKYNRNGTSSSIYGSNGLSGSVIYQFNSTSKQYAVYTQNSSIQDTTNTVYTGASNSSDGVVSNMIASGQAFFIVASAANQSLTFHEQAKTIAQAASANLSQVFAASPTAANNAQIPNAALRVKFVMDNSNTDAVVLQLNNTANPKFDANDVVDLGGDGALIGLSSLSTDSVALTINSLPLPQSSPVISALSVGVSYSGNYTLKMDTIENLPAIYEVWLKDKLLKDSLDFRANSTYNFSIDNSNPATYGTNRFQLVIRQSPALALHLLNFTGSKMPGAAMQSQVNWTVENENNYTTFNVQRSTDGGKTFQSINTLQSNSSGSYSFVDTAPVLGVDYYRLQLTDINNNLTYSQVIGLQYSSLSNNAVAGTLSVYPNPAHDEINVSINAAGLSNAYSIMITSNTGAIVKQVNSVAPSSKYDVSSFVPGAYYIIMTDNATQTVIAQSKFIKL